MKRGVIKVAKKGFDVRYTSPKNLTIDSTKNQFKVFMEGGGKVTFDARPGGGVYQRLSVDVEHNLGYQPSVKMWAGNDALGWRENPITNSGDTGPTSWCTGLSRIDKNTIRFYFYNWDPDMAPHSEYDVYYKYIIFIDPNREPWYE